MRDVFEINFRKFGTAPPHFNLWLFFCTNIFETFNTMEPEIIHALLDRMTDMYLELNEKRFEQLKGKMDIRFFGNDFAARSGLLMSVDMRRGFFSDNLKFNGCRSRPPFPLAFAQVEFSRKAGVFHFTIISAGTITKG